MQRPTLPSLSSLGLPVPHLQRKSKLQGIELSYDSYEAQPCPRLSSPKPHHRHINQQWRMRNVSISSSRSSRTPSPTPSNTTITPVSSSMIPSMTPNATHPMTNKFRLVPSTLDAADAVILVPPPTAPFIPALPSLLSASTTPNPSQPQGQALLLVGSALQLFRNPSRPIAKGARVHPYKIVRSSRK